MAFGTASAAWSFVLCSAEVLGDSAGKLRLVEHRTGEGVSIQVFDGNQPVFVELSPDSNLLLNQPSGKTVVIFPTLSRDSGNLQLTGAETNGLQFSETYRTVAPDLIERTVSVTARADQRYFLDFGWSIPGTGEFYSFLGPESVSKNCSE